MLINKDWDFETAVKEISKVYYPGGYTTGPLRNRQVEAWGQLVGRTRALAEFDAAIKRYGSRSAFGREYRVTLDTLRNFREFFENLPDDQVPEHMVEKMQKVFISYSWDNDEHKLWVRELAARLRSDGIDVTLDQWHLIPGDQLPEFMERSVRESNHVLIICTPKYKERSNNRQGGVGYEGDIITAEFMATRNHRIFIPILRKQTWENSAPNWLLGKYYIDLSTSPYSQRQYDDLLTTLLGTREEAPPVRVATKSESNIDVRARDSKDVTSSEKSRQQSLLEGLLNRLNFKGRSSKVFWGADKKLLTNAAQTYNNYYSAVKDLSIELSRSQVIKIFVATGRIEFTDSQYNWFREGVTKSTHKKPTIRILLSSPNSPYVDIKLKREDSRFLKDLRIVKEIINSYREIYGLDIEIRQHDEPYLWRFYVFDNVAFVSGYPQDSNNYNRVNVYKFSSPDLVAFFNLQFEYL
jgi:hypothetical protein